MNQEEARQAAVAHAIQQVRPGMHIGLGSGRAVFALTRLIGEVGVADIKAVVASPATRNLAEEAGLKLVELTADISLDVAFDGADEIDGSFSMIKGGGAALLTEKLVLATATKVVIMCEQNKVVQRLGSTRLLPVEVVRFGWETTRERVLEIVPEAELRMDAGLPVTTPEGHFLLDVKVPTEGSIGELATALKLTLGVVEHGLFIGVVDEAIVGQTDGSIQILTLS